MSVAYVWLLDLVGNIGQRQPYMCDIKNSVFSGNFSDIVDIKVLFWGCPISVLWVIIFPLNGDKSKIL